MKNRRRAFKRQNRLSKMMISTVFAVLFVVLSINAVSLHKKNQEYIEREEILQAQIADEKERTEEIKEFEKYSQTKEYIEDVAKDKLGLVYKDEIIFKKTD